jgi:uncharacterized protein (TIGR03066 family)
MSVKFGSMLCCLMIGITGCSSSNTTAPSGSGSGAPGPSGGASVVGKWLAQDEVSLPDGSYVEFTGDGKVVAGVMLQGKAERREIGTYKVEGDKITMMAKKKGKDDTQTNTIKTLNADKLVLVDPKGEETVFKRSK